MLTACKSLLHLSLSLRACAGQARSLRHGEGRAMDGSGGRVLSRQTMNRAGGPNAQNSPPGELELLVDGSG
jgi:hypothetical protein